MTTFTDPPKASFRLSQLIYDTRYRSITIQTIAMILLLLGLYWLVNNTVQNLSALGKDFDFGFLSQPAGYDINQRLIEYTSQSTHGRAAIVGILNTLLIAVLGCALATVIGVVVGVLRLSQNWVVSRLMAVYVEGFRNVPLLLWIIAIFALMTEGMSSPRDFRVGGDAAMVLNESVAVTNRGVYVPGIILENGWLASTAINWMIIVAVLIASLFVIRVVRKRADAVQEKTGVRPTTWYQQLALLIIPVGIVLFLMGATMQYPSLKGFNFADGIHLRNSLIAPKLRLHWVFVLAEQ